MQKIKIHKIHIEDKDSFFYHIYLLILFGLISGLFRESLFTIFMFFLIGIVFLTIARKIFVICDKYLRSYYDKQIVDKK